MNDIIFNGTIIQPNSLTNGRYEFTALQKNIIYIALSHIRKDMTKEKLSNKNLFDDYVIDIKISSLAKSKNYTEIIEAAEGMMKKPVKYQYTTVDEGGKKVRKFSVATVLVNTAIHEHGSDIVKLTISKMAVPYILYIGQGFTELQGTIALNLISIYAKRLYEMCCRWKDVGGFVMSLDEFKTILNIEKKYPQISQLRQYILDYSQKELKEKSDVWFEYKLNKTGGSRSFNQIIFKVFRNSVDLKALGSRKGEIAEKMIFIQNFLNYTFPIVKNDKALRITEQLNDFGFVDEAHKRFSALNKEFKDSEIEIKDVIALTYTILRQDFEIKC